MIKLFLLSFWVSLTIFYPCVAHSKAEVVLLKGKAIRIDSTGAKTFLKQGDVFLDDGTLVTDKKSLLRLKLDDGSVLSLGPESKMMIAQVLPGKPKVIDLIQGKLRAQINEHTPVPEEGHKMYIKTRTAALGVRGTDFLIVHNPKNHVTSTLTFKGDVNLFKKRDEDIQESLREELNDQKGRKSLIPNVDQEKDLVNLEDDLRHHSAVGVAPGQLSGAFPSYDKAAAPVKLSPTQFALLAQNSQLEMGAKGKVLKGRKNKKNPGPDNNSLVPVPPGDEPVPDDKTNYDKKNADGVRSGGILDLETGFYLAPPADAAYDPKTQTFEVPAEFGGVDAVTGEYIPPDGLKMDPLHGLVPLLGMGPDYKERDFSKLLAKFKTLNGSFNDRVSKALQIFKELSRLDIYSYVNYRFTTNAMENYYGEWRAITNAPTMLWDWKIQGGFQLYHSPTWLHYPKAYFYSIYHERDEMAIKRNDMMEMMFGWESHYKHYLFKKKARLVFDVEFKTEYLDYQKRRQYDYYSEDSGLKISERFQFNRNHLSELYYQIRAYQGYNKPDHGNIHNGGFTHRFFMGRYYDLQVNYEHSVRKEQWTDNSYKIDRLGGQIILLDLLPHTDVTGGYTWEWNYYQYQPATLPQHNVDRFRLDENMKRGFYYKANMSLNYRLGDFWKINGLYEYSRQRIQPGGYNKAFIEQSWGGGLVMVF